MFHLLSFPTKANGHSPKGEHVKRLAVQTRRFAAVAALALAAALVSSGCGGGDADGDRNSGTQDTGFLVPANLEKEVRVNLQGQINTNQTLRDAGVNVESVDCVPESVKTKFICTVAYTGGYAGKNYTVTVSDDGSRVVDYGS